MPIPKALYAIVRESAKCRCEYCHYPELLSTSPLSVDHLYPQSLGGTDDLMNLALSPAAAVTNDDTTSSPESTRSPTKKPNSLIPVNIHGRSISLGHPMESTLLAQLQSDVQPVIV